MPQNFICHFNQLAPNFYLKNFEDSYIEISLLYIYNTLKLAIYIYIYIHIYFTKDPFVLLKIFFPISCVLMRPKMLFNLKIFSS